MFEENRIYYTDDPALKALGAYQTLAGWRSKGIGPSYIKIGSRVGYLGEALNQWLAERTIKPTAA